MTEIDIDARQKAQRDAILLERRKQELVRAQGRMEKSRAVFAQNPSAEQGASVKRWEAKVQRLEAHIKEAEAKEALLRTADAAPRARREGRERRMAARLARQAK